MNERYTLDDGHMEYAPDEGEWVHYSDYSKMRGEYQTEVHALKSRLESLEKALSKANEQAEHFEREWYLRGDVIESLEKDCEELIKERDEREDVINELLNQVLADERNEWSSAYDFNDAVIDVECIMKSLEKDAERYRWLRLALADREEGVSHHFCSVRYSEELDEAIDTAMQANNR